MNVNLFSGRIDVIGKPHENVVYEVNLIHRTIVCKGVWKDIGH